MIDVALENAITARDELSVRIAAAERQIAEWRARLVRAERFIAEWHEFSEQRPPAPGPSIADEQSHRRRTHPLPTQRAGNSKKEDVAEAARVVLLQHGKPMGREELLAEVLARGLIIEGKDPAVVMQTMLWRMRHVIAHLKGHGYWPVDTAWSPAGYAPQTGNGEAEAGQSLPPDLSGS